jgi:hypothetical protein
MIRLNPQIDLDGTAGKLYTKDKPLNLRHEVLSKREPVPYKIKAPFAMESDTPPQDSGPSPRSRATSIARSANPPNEPIKELIYSPKASPVLPV